MPQYPGDGVALWVGLATHGGVVQTFQGGVDHIPIALVRGQQTFCWDHFLILPLLWVFD
jgi:hypothetical protein